MKNLPRRLARKPLAVLIPLALATTTVGAFAADQTMKEVVVSASGFEQEIVNAPASISVITRKQLEEKKISNLAEAVADIAGVDIDDRNSSGNKTGNRTISIRGLPSNYTLIMIDGRRQNVSGDVTPNAFNDSGSMFIPPVSAIERIEVIRGPMSTLYGSDALGGVVNIITRRPGKTWKGDITLESTFQENRDFGDSRAASIFASGPVVEDVLGLQVYSKTYDRDASSLTWPGQGTTAGSILTMGQNPVKANTQTHGAKLVLTPNKDHDITLNVDQFRSEYDNSKGQIGTLNSVHTQNIGLGNQTVVAGYKPQLNFNRDQIALSHTWRMADGILESSLMHNKTETIGRTIPTKRTGTNNANYVFSSTTAGKAAGSDRTLETESTVFDTKLVKNLGKHMLSIGGQWIEGKMIDGVTPDTMKYTQSGLFLEDEWRFKDDLALTVGARHNEHSIFGSNLSPRAYLVWNATNQWTFKGGVAEGFRAPTLDQISDGLITGYGAQGTLAFIGNGNLKPETSVSHEVSAHYDNQVDFRSSATLFQTDFKNKISFGPRTGTAPNQQQQWTNIEDAEMHGLELDARWKLNPKWSLQGSYTLTHSEHKSGAATVKGTPLVNTPNHMLNATLRWEASPKLTTWLRGEYRSERFRARDSSTTDTPKAALGNFKGYELFDLGATYKVQKDLTLNVGLYNIFNKGFVDYERYVNGATTRYSNTYHSTLESRRLWVSLNKTF